MDYRLILVEGLPGTGKTTLSGQIFKRLIGQGIQAELLLEGNEKIPSNFFDIAGIPKNDFMGYSNCISIVTKTENYVFVKMGDCDEETASQLRRYDVGDEFNPFMSAQEYARCTLEWWQNWVGNSETESVLILDSAFMQCPINEMIFRKATDSQVKTYIRTIAEIIKPLYPLCIYLRRENAIKAIDFAKKVKGERWAKGLEGLADMGCSGLFERRFDLEYMLLSSVASIICAINGYDWSDAETKIQNLFNCLC